MKAAELVFAEHGFAAARLEDVAVRVGIRRASIVYYFRDKQQLYDEVLHDVFGELLARFQTALGGSSPIMERVEAASAAWVSHVGARPSVARILLWESAAGSAGRKSLVAQYTAPVIAAVTEALRDGQRQGIFQPIDPMHFIFTVAGATVFFVAAKPILAPDWPFDPLSPEQLDVFRAEVVHITRRLLGIPESRFPSVSKRSVPEKHYRGRARVVQDSKDLVPLAPCSSQRRTK